MRKRDSQLPWWGLDREVLSSVAPPKLTDRHFTLLFQELGREVKC